MIVEHAYTDTARAEGITRDYRDYLYEALSVFSMICANLRSRLLSEVYARCYIVLVLSRHALREHSWS